VEGGITLKKAFTLIELLIVVAIIAILAAIAVPNFLEAQTRAKVARIQSDQRTYATALETYYIDNNSYPLFSRGAGTPTAGTGKNYNEMIGSLMSPPISPNPYNAISSFALSNTAAHSIGLTSPVSYINTYVPDAFASMKQATFSYASGPAGYLVWSPGPDGNDTNDATTGQTDLGGAGGNNAEFLLAQGSSLPSQTLLTKGKNGATAYTYDPTNGTASQGDVYRTK
jgi:prepilin-type N-terminal cleavage/methylation domain-containing protein